jgi:alpha-L-rhamnosidase
MKKLKYILLLLAVFIGIKTASAAKIELQNLRCEMLVNPLGIDAEKPRLSWEIMGEERGLMQTSYQVLVASSAEKLDKNESDLWDSGKINSDQSIMINYAGKPLLSRQSCFWKVKTWTTNGESNWSKNASFSIGLLKSSDWQAKWIGLDRAFPWDSVSKFSRLSARYFRKTFDANAAVKKATVYIIGLGHYELYLNGKKISDEVLAGAPTDYRKSVLYNTFDVTSEVKKGKNAIGTVLGNGRFFTMRPKYKPKKINEFGFPKMLFQMEIEYANGTKKVIASDGSWKVTADGPIRSNNEYDGEEYDARKEIPAWNNASFIDQKWLKAELVKAPEGKVAAQVNEPIKIMQTVKPVAINQLKPGVFVLDMGQNFAGWLQLKVKGRGGEKVTMRFAETLQKSGELYVANLRDAKVTDVYTLKGAGEEVWEPAFVYHGFRYVEITGYPGKPKLNDFEGKVVCDDIQTIGSFETSNPTINQVYKNAYWGILSNYKGMPVDCPQRNERMPWLGDRATGALGESFIFGNGNLYAKWLDDIEQSQTAEGAIPDVAPAYWNYYSDNMTWPGTYLLIADMLYKQFGDSKPIEKHYSSMKKWLSYMQAKYMKDYILTKDKYGDWCVPPESLELIHAKDTTRTTDGQLIATAYYYRMLFLMKRFAKMLNKPEDAKEYVALSAKIRDAFNQKYLNKQTLQYANGTVTANLLPLYFDITREADRKTVFKNIVNRFETTDKGHIATGVIGTQWLMRGLTEYGRPDLSYKLAANDDYPSWGYMAKHGATTIWELWNGDTANPSMNSGNHVMLLGDLITWYYQNLAGIKAGINDPGFKQIIMKPSVIEGLNEVNSSYKTPYGLVKSSWKKEGNQFNWKITVPGNAKALVSVPAASQDQVMEGGKKTASGVKFIKMEDGRAVFEVGSGDYEFQTKI